MQRFMKRKYIREVFADNMALEKCEVSTISLGSNLLCWPVLLQGFVCTALVIHLGVMNRNISREDRNLRVVWAMVLSSY